MRSTTEPDGAPRADRPPAPTGRSALVAALFFAVTLACGGLTTSTRHPLVDSLYDPPPDIRQACELAELRCSQCHPLERVSRARIGSPSHWQRYVARMRLKPGSEIAPDEEPALVRCLVYRQFGEAGLEQLDTRAAP